MVNINNVYQKVLALANKEQRGYITPQEFNLFADHAQMEIFEQYFYDINQWTKQRGNSHEYSDMLVNLEEKIDKFASIAIGDNVTVLNQYGDINLNDDLPDLYRLGSVRVSYPVIGYKTAERMRSRKEFLLYESSPLTKRNEQRPMYHRQTIGINDRIKIYPYPVNDDGSNITTPTMDNVQVDYVRKPTKPNWMYVVVNDKPLYNSTESVDFELHASEETELVYRILALAGIAIEKPQLTQVAAGLQGAQVQQEKQ